MCTVIQEIFMLKNIRVKFFVLKIFGVLGRLCKFNSHSIIYCMCDRRTWRSCEDLAAFEATKFIVLYGNQPLEKNWRVIIPEILCVSIICSWKYFMLKIFRVENILCLIFVVFGDYENYLTTKNFPNYSFYIYNNCCHQLKRPARVVERLPRLCVQSVKASIKCLNPCINN